MDEIGEVRGWRLGAIVHTLRSKYGWPIRTEYRGPENIAHYSLTHGATWHHWRFPPSAQMLKDRMQGETVPAIHSDAPDAAA